MQQLSPQDASFIISISNVPGPLPPLYSMGCKRITSLGLGPGPISQSVRLIMPMTMCCGELNIAVTACRSTLPDPDIFVHRLEEAFEEFAAATLN